MLAELKQKIASVFFRPESDLRRVHLLQHLVPLQHLSFSTLFPLSSAIPEASQEQNRIAKS